MESTCEVSYEFVKYAKVALDLKIDKLLEYGIESQFEKRAVAGARVVVPLNNQMIEGVIIEVVEKKSFEHTLPLIEVSDTPLLSSELLQLAHWVSDYYHTPINQVLFLFIPSAIKKHVGPKVESYIERRLAKSKMIEALPQFRKKFKKQALILDFFLKSKKSISKKELLTTCKTTIGPIQALIDKGFLKEVYLEIERPLLDHVDFIKSAPKKLTPQQEIAVAAIEAQKDFRVFVLHGLTGSGKTEVYLQAMERVLNNNQSVLLMVPEISLTHQTIERLYLRFGKKIAILHHKLSNGERFDEWQKVYTQNAPIVVGPRSSVFSPIKNLGLIIVDEEHDPSYKQTEKMPTYNAKDCAIMRAKMNQVPIILGSATPSIESYVNCQKSSFYTLLQLQERINQSMPKVFIVDMNKEHEKKNFLFSDLFLEKFKKNLENKEQTLIFLNRRGFHAMQVCPECTASIKCPHCDLSLTFHKAANKLTCHLCAFELYPPPKTCPECAHEMLQFRGVGTQFVETKLKMLFPNVKVVRMDADTTKAKNAHKILLDQFQSKRADILLGTQMIAKGLHIPSVTLVLVLNCDLMLNLPDFKAHESVFQLITQVSGRSGRGHLPGEVVLQTKQKNHPIIQFASAENYKAFFEHELKERAVFSFPPHTHLLKVILKAFDEKSILEFGTELFVQLKKILPVGYTLYPLAPCGISKIKDQFRYQILLKGQKIKTMNSLFDKIAIKKPKHVNLFFDVDPYSTFF
jgi:primosomal protein N' (replication factor Y)